MPQLSQLTHAGRKAAQVVQLPPQTRDAAVVPSTFREADNSIEVVWTTGARRRMYDYSTGRVVEEELLVTPEAVDMTRFERGVLQVIDAHDTWSGTRAILGIATDGRIAGGQGLARIAFSTDPAKQGVVGDIKAGIIRAMSFGYTVQLYEVVEPEARADGGGLPLYRAKRWTPQELTFCAVGADPNASPRAAGELATRQQPHVHGTPCEFIRADAHSKEHPMTTTIQPAGAASHAELDGYIRATCQRHGLGDGFATRLIAQGLDERAANRAMLDALAAQDDASGGQRNVNPSLRVEPDRLRDDLRRDPRAGDLVDDAVDALASRYGVRSERRDNPYAHARITDIARDMLELRGVRTTGMSPSQLIERSLHTTSDFPHLLQGTGQRVLRHAYMANSASIKRICRPSTAVDFRAKQKLMLGDAPQLLKVNEAGEFHHGSMAEAKETYALATYGRIFGVTRQALVNDDLDAFGDMAMRFGQAAATLEAQVLVTLLTSNPTLAQDSTALFHANHGNLGTGAGSALQESSLSAARLALRLMKGLDGVTPIDASPKYLIVPAALETAAQKLLATITPATSETVNPFAGQLELVVDPRLDAVSATAWYLAADSSVIDTIEYSYLDSAAGPEVFVEEGFVVDGVRMKARLDFGAGVLDFRGLYKANGA